LLLWNNNPNLASYYSGTFVLLFGVLTRKTAR
jgi:hypothetical protein